MQEKLSDLLNRRDGRGVSGAADRISRSSIGWMDMRPTEDGPKTLEESFF